MVLAKIALGLVGTVAVAGAAAFHQGVITVQVENRNGRDGNVWVIAPAAVVPFVLKFVPEEHLRELPHEARQFMPALRLAAKELERMPDTVLVEVEKRDEYVKIYTRRGYLIIDVDKHRERVHVSIPLKTLESAAGELVATNSRWRDSRDWD